MNYSLQLHNYKVHLYDKHTWQKRTITHMYVRTAGNAVQGACVERPSWPDDVKRWQFIALTVGRPHSEGPATEKGCRSATHDGQSWAWEESWLSVINLKDRGWWSTLLFVTHKTLLKGQKTHLRSRAVVCFVAVDMLWLKLLWKEMEQVDELWTTR